ncbi:MAG: hypothetical protein ACD_12C00617G0004, partial [uncultured bacterium]
MRKFKNNIKKNFLFLFIFIQIGFLITGGSAVVNGADLVAPANQIAPAPTIGQSSIKGPRADVIFSDSIGDKGVLEATAIVTGFETKNEDLYFTWYLKRSGGRDLDGDGKYDENDWKIEATKIIATNGYSGQSNGSTSADDDGYDALPEWTGRNSDPECYVQDFEDGLIYELKQTEQSFSCASAACVSERNLS